MTDSETVRAHVIVLGLVQGVFYRWTAAEEARARALGGWVRNLADGRVEAAFEGRRELVESMIAWCREGPPMARVDSVDVSWEDPTGEQAFVVRD